MKAFRQAKGPTDRLGKDSIATMPIKAYQKVQKARSGYSIEGIFPMSIGSAEAELFNDILYTYNQSKRSWGNGIFMKKCQTFEQFFESLQVVLGKLFIE